MLDSIETFYGIDAAASGFQFRTQLTARSPDETPKRLSYLSTGVSLSLCCSF